MRPYVIYNPGYTHMSGGIRALYKLKDEIFKRGLQVGFHDQFRDQNEITVYPEIITGNPLNSPHYIKWLLNKADFYNETCYAWEYGMGNYPYLTVNIVEMDLWKPSKNKSNGVAYWVGKGSVDYSVLPDEAVEINKQVLTNRAELANFISELDYLISFDPYSAINFEATIAGTPVLIYMPKAQWSPLEGRHIESLWSKEELEKHSWMQHGIAWGPDELESAKQTVALARDHYESLLNVFDQRVDTFIEHTQTAQ